MALLNSKAWFPKTEHNAGNWAPILGASVVINVPDTLYFETGEGVSLQLLASGEPAPTWSIPTGTLPTGLTLTSGGLLSGTVTAAPGSFTVTFQAANASSSDGKQVVFTIVAANSGAPPTLVSTEDMITLINSNFSKQLVATGNPIPTWSVLSGTLPIGVTLSSSGLLSGTPAEQGRFIFTARAVNSAGIASRQLALEVHQVPVILVSGIVNIPNGIAIDVPLSAVGYPAITWGLAGTSALPAGLFLSSSGSIIGSTNEAGIKVVQISAVNQAGVTTQQITLNVALDDTSGGGSTNTTVATSFFAIF